MSKSGLGIVWFRQDLRLADNPALEAACNTCEQVLCVYIDDPVHGAANQPGAASRVWLHHSLASLQASLRNLGSELCFSKGGSLDVLKMLAEQTHATNIFWNRCYDPATIERDTRIKQALTALKPRTFNSLLIHEPWQVLKRDGNPYRVFTPYWKAVVQQLDGDTQWRKRLTGPAAVPALNSSVADSLISCCALDELSMLPTLGWGKGMMSHWQPGEKAVRSRLKMFLQEIVHGYDESRNIPAVDGTSRLSPHLHFGEISPRQVLLTLLGKRPFSQLEKNEQTFAKEVVWREFGYSLIYHFPHTINEPLDSRFKRFSWSENHQSELLAWKEGRTGIPFVDAGMRELYATGWMHNRVRMVVASFLIKNLLIPWQSGESWFRDTLVDADVASNVMGWQWCAGSGADASPFFRVFNPVLQGEKFDKQGEYVKRWVPELSDVPAKFIHKPWELPAPERGKLHYPAPLVDLKSTRLRALEVFSAVKGTNRVE